MPPSCLSHPRLKGVQNDVDRFFHQWPVVPALGNIHDEPHRFDAMAGVEQTSFKTVQFASVGGNLLAKNMPSCIEKQGKNLVQAGINCLVEYAGIKLPLQFERQIGQDHWQRQRDHGPGAGDGLCVFALGIVLAAQNIPVSMICDLPGLLVLGRQRVLAEGHRRKTIGENVIGLHERPAIARQAEIPVASLVPAVALRETPPLAAAN